jgi:hypothetical protein
MSTQSGSRELRVSVRSVREEQQKFVVVVEIHNETDRTLHYIGDVRAIDYDPGTRRLRLRLSDRGLEPDFGTAYVLPNFRAVEPNAVVSLALAVPRTIVRLAESPTPLPYPRFEERRIAQASDIEVDIGWSRTPFYPDPRERAEGLPRLDEWEDGTARTLFSRSEERKRD